MPIQDDHRSASKPARTHDANSPADDAAAGSRWYLALARDLGRALRWVRLDASVMGEAIQRIADATVPASSPPIEGAPTDVDGVLRELGYLVSESEEEGYESLRDDTRFWALVDRLHASSPKRHGAAATPRTVRASPEPEVHTTSGSSTVEAWESIGVPDEDSDRDDAIGIASEPPEEEDV